jgi:hypothetical protein
LSQLWHSRLQRRPPPSTTGWEGAEAARGGGAAAGKVDGEGVGLLACGRAGSFPIQQLARVGYPGPATQTCLQDVFKVGLGEVNVLLRHAVADLAQAPTDVGQTGAVTQQTGGRGMPGLVRDPAAEGPTPGWRARRRLGSGFARSMKRSRLLR